MASGETSEDVLQSIEAELAAADGAEDDVTEEESNRGIAGEGEQESAQNSSAAVLDISEGSSSAGDEHEMSTPVAALQPTAAAPAASEDGRPVPAPTTSAELDTRPRAATMPTSQPEPARQQQADFGEGGLSVVGSNRSRSGSVMESFYGLAESAKKRMIRVQQSTAEMLVPGRTITTDPKLADRITTLISQKQKYGELLKVSLKLCAQVLEIKNSQRELANIFATLTARVDELHKELDANTETQRQLARNGDILYHVLCVFCTSLRHLINTQMEDTFKQLKAYQTARLDFDAYRNGEENARAQLAARPEDQSRKARHERKVHELEERKRLYETLRKDLTVRVHFLEQNQVSVLTRQLTMLHNASVAYFTGNADELEKCIRQFSIKMPRHLGQDAPNVGEGTAARATTTAAGKSEASASMEPLPFPTPTELGTPSEALTALLTHQASLDSPSPTPDSSRNL